MTHVRVTQHTVTAYPDPDSINADLYEIQVEYRGEGRWGVCRHKRCLDANGVWDWESIPSERTDEWLATHRFDEQTALRLAEQAAPDLVVNGMSVAECWAWEQRRAAEIAALNNPTREVPR